MLEFLIDPKGILSKYFSMFRGFHYLHSLNNVSIKGAMKFFVLFCFCFWLTWKRQMDRPILTYRSSHSAFIGLFHINCALSHRGGWISKLFWLKFTPWISMVFDKNLCFTWISRKDIHKHQKSRLFSMKISGFPEKKWWNCLWSQIFWVH